MSKTKWYQKPIYLLVALALVLSLGIVALPMAGTVGAAPGTIQVDVNDPGCVTGPQTDPYSVVYCSIKDAIADATAGDTINVAAGTYDENITLKDGVEILGAGAAVTTIDGGGTDSVVKGSNVGSTTKLDGFTITNGSGDYGGGMNITDGASPIISNCIFSGNSATYYGGGMYNSDASPTVTNCTFKANSANKGGGMGNWVGASPTVTNCTFDGNSASSSGGGMYNIYSSSPTVANCTFDGNSATSSGGGMYNVNSSPTVTNCTFRGNSASTVGGGMHNSNSSPTVTNCIFEGNSAPAGVGGMGGGMFNDSDSFPNVTRCTFEGNSANKGGGMCNWQCPSLTVTNCVFKDNSAYNGGGMYNYKSSPVVANCIFEGNSYRFGCGMTNSESSPTVTNCIFRDNQAGWQGGGMFNYKSSPAVTNCIFHGNSAGSRGGGMYSWSSSSPTVTNCIFANNSAGSSIGGLYADGSSSPAIDYNDVWNNPGGNYGGSCSPGPHDISQDPLFVDPAAHDYHSKPGSPCIDAGTNDGAPSEDMDGNPRPIDGDGDGWAITDMGAYEYVRPTPQPHFRYLHSTSGWFNLTTPVGTQWHELWPVFCREYHLSSWNDTGGDGLLSRCDRIDMYQKPDGELKSYHVEEVTITLNVTQNRTGERMYIELEGGYNASVLNNPLDTQWHQIYPILCRQYELISWNDTSNITGELDFCDTIELKDKWTQEKTRWHVEEVAIDIIVTIEPPPVGGEAYPVNKVSLLAPWIALAVLLAGGISWFALRRRRAQS